MARRSPLRIVDATGGAVAPIIAISLFGLIAAGGIAFDYARLVGMHSELQSAADQAALAAATQLDGKSGACSRAVSAARNLIQNDTAFANDGSGLAVTIADEPACDATDKVKFYATFTDASSNTAANSDATAHFVSITVGARTANYALTPVVAALSSGNVDATAVAGVGNAICKEPPVMLCNPAEPAGNTDELLGFNPTAGQGMKLVTGNATVPGNFGWLESNGLNGANGPKEAMGYNSPPGPCQPMTGVTTKTGMVASVLDALNSRFDVFANGNSTCPNQDGGTCSPSLNSRKDLICPVQNANSTSCKSDNWSLPSPRYDGSATTPEIMGYPRDACHVAASPTCGIMGDGSWDRNKYFKVNYGYADQSAWTSGTGLSSTATRYQAYQWEAAHTSVSVNGVNKGIGVAQILSGNKTAAFGQPATGRAGLPITPIDRRRISVAVINCQAEQVKGKTTNIPVSKWLDVFLVEPAVKRGKSGDAYFTDDKEVYVEVIGETGATGTGSTAQVIQKSVPYLVE